MSLRSLQDGNPGIPKKAVFRITLICSAAVVLVLFFLFAGLGNGPQNNTTTQVNSIPDSVNNNHTVVTPVENDSDTDLSQNGARDSQDNETLVIAGNGTNTQIWDFENNTHDSLNDTINSLNDTSNSLNDTLNNSIQRPKKSKYLQRAEILLGGKTSAASGYIAEDTWIRLPGVVVADVDFTSMRSTVIYADWKISEGEIIASVRPRFTAAVIGRDNCTYNLKFSSYCCDGECTHVEKLAEKLA